jgi:hypothetical protein
MIAEIIPEAYDARGKKVFRPFDRRHGPHPTFPMGRYLSQPLTIKCRNLSEVRAFLRECKGVPDDEQFGREDYWQPPEQFEQSRKGDCDDFALWTWRQLLDMDYDSRVVFGQYGRYGIGHAWVQFFDGDRTFLVEPQLSVVGERMPRLQTLRYHPGFSVAWNGETLAYYQHSARKSDFSFWRLAGLFPEYFAIWTPFWIRNAPRMPRSLRRTIARIARSFRWPKICG